MLLLYSIVDACKKTIQAQIDSCAGNDWICLCDQYTNLLTYVSLTF